MPNWSYAESAIYSKKKQTVKELSERINKILNSPTRTPNQWHNSPNWIGNILISLGLNEKDVMECKYIYLRSSIIKMKPEIKEIQYKGETLYYFLIDLSSAYYCSADAWQNILEELYPEDKTIGISYFATTENTISCDRKEAGLAELLFNIPAKFKFTVFTGSEENYEDFIQELMTPEQTRKLIAEKLGKEYPLEYFMDQEKFLKLKPEMPYKNNKWHVDVEPIYTWDTL